MKMMDAIIRSSAAVIILSLGLFTMPAEVSSGESGKLPGDNNGGELPGLNNEASKTPIIISESELREAALKGDTEKMRLLIAAGADINQPVTNLSQQTVLMIAAEKGHNELVEMLLEAEADINAVDGNGPDDLSYDQDNAFMYAVRGGHYDTVKLFIGLGVAINQQNRARKTPIFLAANDGYDDIVNLLIENGADVNLPAKHSPLYMSIWDNHTGVVKTLIGAGADVNINNGEALRRACFRGHQEIVKVLLEAGAGVNLKSVTGIKGEERVETALRAAKKQGHDNIVSLLKAAGAVE